MGWKKEYLAVGESLVAGSKALGKWKVADMTIGLSYLGEARREQLKEDPGLKTRGLENSENVSKERLETFEWACDLAEIAYIGEESVMRKLLQEMDLTLVHGEVESKFAVPAHYWAYNKERKQCVFAVRGTASRKDMLTDLDSYPEDFQGKYKVHRGMMQSARSLAEKVSKQLQDLSSEGFHISVVGHSLGAGTAALLSVLLKKEYEIDNLTCFAIATPPVADLSLCLESQSYINTLVNNDDIVCRISLSNIKCINRELLDLPWMSMAASDLSQATKAGAMAEYMGVKMGEFQARVSTAKVYNKTSDTMSKAAGKLKPKIGSLTSYATDKMSKVKLGLGSIGRKKSNASAEAEENKPSVDATKEQEAIASGDAIEVVRLLPPGKIVYLSMSGGSDDDDGESSKSPPSFQAHGIHQKWEGLNRIELSNRMLRDHFLSSYFDALKLAMKKPVEEPQLVLSNIRMLKLEAGKKAMLGLAEWKEREVKLLKLRRKHFQIRYVSKGGLMKDVELKGARVCKLKMSERPFAFSIEGPDKTVKLDPGNEEEMDRWISALGTLLPTT